MGTQAVFELLYYYTIAFDTTKVKLNERFEIRLFLYLSCCVRFSVSEM